MSQHQSTNALKPPLKAKISPEEYQLLQDLRDRSCAQNPPKLSLSLGERVAERVAAVKDIFFYYHRKYLRQLCLRISFRDSRSVTKSRTRSQMAIECSCRWLTV